MSVGYLEENGVSAMPNGTDLVRWSPPGGGEVPQGVIDFHGGSLSAVYDYYESLNSDELRASIWAYETGQAEQLATVTAGWEQGIDTLMGARTGILDDPYMEDVFASLAERAGPDYDVIGEPGRAAMGRGLATGINRAQSDRATALRRAGLSGSGMDIENAPLFAAIGSTGLADINAEIEMANEEARSVATTQLGEFSQRRRGMLAPFDMAIAGLQTDVPTSGYDPLLGPSIDWQMDRADIADQQYEEERAREEAAMAAFEESQPFAWLDDPWAGIFTAGSDILGAAFPFLGSGAYRTILP